MGIKEGLKEIWDDMMSYRTLKVVKISDARLAYVHKTLMASILVYSTVTMIGGHTYMLKEKPRVYVATTVDDSARLSNFNKSAAEYCDKSLTDFSGDPYVTEGPYMNNSCADYLATPQITKVDDASAFIGTHMRQRYWERTCTDATDKSTCEVQDVGEPKNFFPSDTESLIIQFQPSYVTSWQGGY